MYVDPKRVVLYEHDPTASFVFIRCLNSSTLQTFLRGWPSASRANLNTAIHRENATGGFRCVLRDVRGWAFTPFRFQKRSESVDSWPSLTINVARSILASGMVPRSLKSPLTKGFCATELNWTLAEPNRLVAKESRWFMGIALTCSARWNPSR